MEGGFCKGDEDTANTQEESYCCRELPNSENHEKLGGRRNKNSTANSGNKVKEGDRSLGHLERGSYVVYHYTYAW